MAVREPVEVEVKFTVLRPRALARLLREGEPLRSAGFSPVDDARVVRVTDRYLDTESGPGLASRGIRARLRRRAGETLVTVKRPGEVRDGVTTRVELEAPATPSLDPARWPASAAKLALDEARSGSPLREVGRLRQRRLTRHFRKDAGGTVLEVSLDAVEAIVGGRVAARRHELEVELLSGRRDDLAQLAAALAAHPDLGPVLGSKRDFALNSRPS
jgi:inorganic triphosphatase YgiF